MVKAGKNRTISLMLVAALVFSIMAAWAVPGFAAPSNTANIGMAQEMDVKVTSLSKPAVLIGVENQVAGSIRITEEETGAVSATNLWLSILPNELGVQDVTFSDTPTVERFKDDIVLGNPELVTGSLLRIPVIEGTLSSVAGILISDIKYDVSGVATENGVVVEVLEGVAPPTAVSLGLTANAIVVAALPAPFPDVPSTHFAATAIDFLVDLGVIDGYPDGLFRPNANVSRAEFAKMAVEAAGLDLITPAVPSFPDVPTTHWAFSYIETARAAGIIEGYPDGTFRPNANITRAEITAIVVRAAGFPVNLACTQFQDVPEGHWAFEFIMTARNHGIVQGFPDGTFRPNNPATRAEAAVMIFNWVFEVGIED